VLSDKYRRLDSRPIFEAFATAAAQVGLVPIDGVGADTKWSVRALLPKVFEPIEHEVMSFGLELRNSDYGDGKLQISIFVDRLWCTNMATLKDELSKVHLGARLPDDLRLSQKTYDLDTETFASAIRDITTDCLSPKRVEDTCQVIRDNADREMNWNQAKRLLGTKLNKGELTETETLFEKGCNTDQVPVKQSRWKLSNAVSWLANGVDDPARKMELQKLSGDLLN
jgi:hypothetical protein